jgi:hypothetical protein
VVIILVKRLPKELKDFGFISFRMNTYLSSNDTAV